MFSKPSLARLRMKFSAKSGLNALFAWKLREKKIRPERSAQARAVSALKTLAKRAYRLSFELAINELKLKKAFWSRVKKNELVLVEFPLRIK